MGLCRESTRSHERKAASTLSRVRCVCRAHAYETQTLWKCPSLKPMSTVNARGSHHCCRRQSRSSSSVGRSSPNWNVVILDVLRILILRSRHQAQWPSYLGDYSGILKSFRRMEECPSQHDNISNSVTSSSFLALRSSSDPSFPCRQGLRRGGATQQRQSTRPPQGLQSQASHPGARAHQPRSCRPSLR